MGLSPKETPNFQGRWFLRPCCHRSKRSADPRIYGDPSSGWRSSRGFLTFLTGRINLQIMSDGCVILFLLYIYMIIWMCNEFIYVMCNVFMFTIYI